VRKTASNAGPKAVDEYLERVPEPARATLEKVRSVIRAAAPAEATEAISYGIPAFKYKGMLLGFGAFPDHCSLFVMNPPVMAEFEKDLKGFRTSKGTIHFPVDKPLSTVFLKKLVKARVAQNENKKPETLYVR
jgi:uncharacterized protein YdhG (YjbR/CyaY superfamily)